LAEGKPFPQLQERIEQLKQTDGAKFFDPARTEFPQADFPLCVDCDRFPFVLRLERDEKGRNRMVPVYI
jgi:2-phosphosulfolactate phosphatase